MSGIIRSEGLIAGGRKPMWFSACRHSLMNRNLNISEKIICYHCGEDCATDEINYNNHVFCCEGCKMVYGIINKSNLCEYYDIEKNPGITQKNPVREGKFAFLEDESVKKKLIHFSEQNQHHITFYLPQMHCSSCIWLLEHLGKLNAGIARTRVNFLRKEFTVVFDENKISFKKLAELMSSIGYEPYISLNDISENSVKKVSRSHIYKIGIAGFCFGNIMMLSFPDYFSGGEVGDLQYLFNYLNLFLSLPVFFYCASEFFISAYKGLKQKFLNIDAPIGLAILITFTRSVYEILSNTGVGYLDSMSGIVFFMLIGRYFQNKTHFSLSFNRNYKSYFPLGINVIDPDGNENQIPVSKIKVGDRIKVYSNEIIPADAILFLGDATIDYSFVTGESLPVRKSIGEIVYAGGKQVGGAIELEVVKEVSQSYLTQLWNNDAFSKKDDKDKSFIQPLSRYFTLALFSVAITTSVYWYLVDYSKMWQAVTAVLIVACPCALLLSSTFTNGSMLAVLQRYGLYLKSENILEKISQIKTIAFDKTGTITEQTKSKIIYQGNELTHEDVMLVRTLANQSSHPLSRSIVSYFPFSRSFPVKKFYEEKGKGSSAIINGHLVKLGSADFMVKGGKSQLSNGSNVFVEIDHKVMGNFSIKSNYRNGLKEIFDALEHNYKLVILSGDNNAEEAYLKLMLGNEAELKFNMSPYHKLDFIKSLQKKNKVMMIGDGLNDAGALMQCDVGLAITDNINNFTPESDGILDGSKFTNLPLLMEYCRKHKFIIGGSFILSIFYNIIGLSFAVHGTLSPVIAAILMPVSSISIILFTTGMSSLLSYKLKSKKA